MTTSTETTTLLDSTAPAGDTPPAADAKTEVTPPATETKTETPGDADKAAADAAAKVEADAKAAADKAPEKYEPFTLPDDQEIDTALLDEFTPTLKELNLNQESAQKVINFAPKLVQATVEKTTASVLTALGLSDHAQWAGQSKADKEIGGEKFAENLATAQKAAQTFATPELTALLKQTGLGNHPEVLRLFHRIGKQISEDGFVPGGKSQAPKSLEARLYPNSHAA